MKKVASTCRILSLTLFTIFISSCASQGKLPAREIASLEINKDLEGIWFVQGSNTVRGPYNGEIEIRKASDGSYNAVRVVAYINTFYDRLKVQEVWTGKAALEGNSLVLKYSLKRADYITQLDSQKRAPDDFKVASNVIEVLSPTEKGLSGRFYDGKFSFYTEWLTTRRQLEAKPLWSNEKRYFDARGPKIPMVVRGVIAGFSKKIGYKKDPLVKSYSHRKEFKDEAPVVVFDPTDFDFYRKNRNTVRVANKIMDDISLAEAVVKRNAYALTLEEKQHAYDRNTVTNHINELGMACIATVDDNGNLLRYEPDGDSALWTGMYVTSQAMRYLTTREPEALQNVRKSVKGLLTLIDITGNPKEFARTLATYSPGQPIPQKWHQGTGVYQNVMWLEGGNNDMIKGITHGMLAASLVIPESDTEIWEQLRDKSKKLLNLKVIDDKKQNLPHVLGLAALITKDPDFHKQYVKSYKKFAVKKSGYSFDTSFYWRGTADWSGINLGVVGDITSIVIADKLGEHDIRDRLRERLMDSWVVYVPAQRHLVTLAAYAFAYSQGTTGDNFRDEASHQRFQESLNQAVWGLREIPYPRPNLNMKYDHSLNPEWCVSPIPRMFWKATKDPMPPMEYFYQGLYEYPVFERNAFDSNFIWKDGAFLYKGERIKNAEFAGIDYLYGYWIARFSKVPNLN